MDQIEATGSPIIVIGAGAAGLMAAKELSAKGRFSIILEASDKPGGRIRTVRDSGFLHPVEAGAEFVHGKLPITLSLLKQAGITFRPVKGKMMHVEKGKWVPRQGIDDQWEEMLAKMQGIKEDMPLSQFLDLHLEGKKYKELRDSVRGFAEGFDLADVNLVSTLALRKEWMHEDHEQFRVKGGYGRLIEWMAAQCQAAGCELHTQSPVKRIEWERDKVQVFTAGGKRYTGSKVIITTSLGVLQAPSSEEASFQLFPSPEEHLLAARKIGYGAVLKILLQFKNTLQKKELGKAGFILCDRAIRTWWTQVPDNNPLLTGWMGGPSVKEFELLAPEAILEIALDSLKPIVGLEKSAIKQQLAGWKIVHWGKDPFSLGGYSYDMPASPAARRLLQTPVLGTIYFAGEALYEGPAPGTVEAAFSSGAATAARILEK